MWNCLPGRLVEDAGAGFGSLGNVVVPVIVLLRDRPSRCPTLSAEAYVEEPASEAASEVASGRAELLGCWKGRS